MITNFNIVSAVTVPRDYSWDKGIPFTNNLTTKNIFSSEAFVPGETDSSSYNEPINPDNPFVLNTNTNYISGYAPGVRIVLQNTSIPNPEYFNAYYEWNFGDYYNNTGTYTLSCLSQIEHTYILPGTYTVSLKLKQIKVNSQLITEDPTCRGLYGIKWFWDDLRQNNENNLTWNQLTCNTPVTASFKLKKWWTDEADCLQKYCLFWSWGQTREIDGRNPVTWSQSDSFGEYSKTWEFENNDIECFIPEAKYLQSFQPIEQDYIIQNFIEVKELLPVAGLYSVTQPVSGTSPYTIQLTPRTTKLGSFPLEKIDWNFGDGTPTITITRNSLSTENLIFTNTFSADPNDVRNFDILHTYYLTKNNYPIFYPSLTCYSSNTNSNDSCCITIGPIGLTNQNFDFNLIKVKNTNDGDLYAFNINNSLVFNTNNTEVSSIKNINYPPTKIRNSYNEQVLYTGNPGDNYPPPYTPTCI